jgi:hypothetical protein
MTWTLALNGPLSWVVGYDDYDVFWENDRGSQVYTRCKK